MLRSRSDTTLSDVKKEIKPFIYAEELKKILAHKQEIQNKPHDQIYESRNVYGVPDDTKKLAISKGFRNMHTRSHESFFSRPSYCIKKNETPFRGTGSHSLRSQRSLSTPFQPLDTAYDDRLSRDHPKTIAVLWENDSKGAHIDHWKYPFVMPEDKQSVMTKEERAQVFNNNSNPELKQLLPTKRTSSISCRDIHGRWDSWKPVCFRDDVPERIRKNGRTKYFPQVPSIPIFDWKQEEKPIADYLHSLERYQNWYDHHVWKPHNKAMQLYQPDCERPLKYHHFSTREQMLDDVHRKGLRYVDFSRDYYSDRYYP